MEGESLAVYPIERIARRAVIQLTDALMQSMWSVVQWQGRREDAMERNVACRDERHEHAARKCAGAPCVQLCRSTC